MRGGDQIPGADQHRRPGPPPVDKHRRGRPRHRGLAPDITPSLGPVRFRAGIANDQFPAHFTVTLMVPSPCAFAKNQFTPLDTFSPNSRLTSSGTSRERNDPATSSAASATPCSRSVNLPPSRTCGGPPRSATRSLSADSNSTSEPSSSVNRTNSAITHPRARTRAVDKPLHTSSRVLRRSAPGDWRSC